MRLHRHIRHHGSPTEWGKTRGPTRNITWPEPQTPTPTPKPPTWTRQANCANSPLDFTTTRAGTRKERHALAVCTNCPVRVECLESAAHIERRILDAGAHLSGVLGGLTAKQREAIYRRDNSR